MTSSKPVRYPIEDGVPIPPTIYEGRRGRRGNFPLLDMDVGQSIRVSGEDVDKARTAVTNANSNHRDKGMYWVVGLDEAGVNRIWRKS